MRLLESWLKWREGEGQRKQESQGTFDLSGQLMSMTTEVLLTHENGRTWGWRGQVW